VIAHEAFLRVRELLSDYAGLTRPDRACEGGMIGRPPPA